jgi:cytidyltransferase-like protein
MKTVGLITEYNPFHKGHLYHLNKAKELTGADRVIVVMSGDFVQRGVPAITDKFTRAHMALAEGADLVLELPCIYATASAEFFALGAVSLLTKLGCVDYLCFGSECGDISLLSDVADFLLKEPVEYQTALKAYLQSGKSYPAARLSALSDTWKEDVTAIENILAAPNNILALEYLKALTGQNSSITPVTIQRVGADYHADNLSSEFSSATALRKAILESPDANLLLEQQIPTQAAQVLATALSDNGAVSANDFSAFLSYALLMKKEYLTDYLDVDSDLADRIVKMLPEYTDYTAFADLLKTKAYTHTRITRSLCHILLDIQKEHMNTYLSEGICFYAKALGFRREAAPLLKALKGHSSIPLITKLSKASSVLTPIGQAMLNQDLKASEIYHNRPTKKGSAYNEYTKPLIIL